MCGASRSFHRTQERDRLTSAQKWFSGGFPPYKAAKSPAYTHRLMVVVIQLNLQIIRVKPRVLTPSSPDINILEPSLKFG